MVNYFRASCIFRCSIGLISFLGIVLVGVRRARGKCEGNVCGMKWPGHEIEEMLKACGGYNFGMAKHIQYKHESGKYLRIGRACIKKKKGNKPVGYPVSCKVYGTIIIIERGLN